MLANMPLRHKMTLFYVALTLVLLAILLPVLYVTTRNVLIANQEDILRLTHAQLGSDVEMEDGIMVLENTIDLTRISGFSIRFQDGRIIAQERMPKWTEELPFQEDIIRRLEVDDDMWLILDGIAEEDGIPVNVRAVLSLEQVEDTLRVIKAISVTAVPVLLLASVLGGLMIARRSLKPIDRIISTTRVIAGGDLSGRIDDVHTKDEVGELAAMMNDMLESVEKAFEKEKRFASDASHELRTPVSIIMAYAEELLDSDLPESEKKSLLTIQHESQRMERIIAQLLMITRGQEKRYPVEIEPLDMPEIVESVALQLAPQAEARDIAIRADVANGLHVRGDQSLITQMLLNLVENAIRYGRQGGKVDIGVAAAEGAQCTIRVSDDGIGIAADQIPLLFDRFFRVDATRDRTGSGLGLSIVKWIVEEIHGGTIEVESEVGKGSAFIITI